MTSRERARRVLARADVLGRVSEESGVLTRRFATGALGEAAALVEGWLREAGLTVRRDAVGNVVARAGGDGPPLVLGSHLDTVRDAGRYDGVLGVLCAIEVADAVGSTVGPLEVVAFADEEGARFTVAYLGSSAYRGRFDPAWLELRDAGGVAMGDAIEAAGGDPAALRASGGEAVPLAGYLEVHIEQGPVLEAEGLPVGVVSAVAGQTRVVVSLTGRAGHAGTVPVELRADALAGAAELLLAAEAAMRAEPGLMATVGSVEARPGAPNVVPGFAALTLDVRHADDGIRDAAVEMLERTAVDLAGRRGLEIEWVVVQEMGAVALDPALTERLARSLAACGVGVPHHPLVSGAGHDAVVLARDTPAAMLFVRCEGGVSHSPAERVAEADVAVALDVVLAAVRK